MKKFSFNSIIRKQSPIFTNVFIEATWKSPHRYISISFDIGIDIAKKFGFAFRIYFLKIEYLFFPVLSFGISTILLQILISLRFPFHPSKGVYWCFRKRLVGWTFGSTHPLVFWKNNYYKNFSIFCILSSETSRVEFFLSRFADFTETFPKRSLEQLFWREPVSVCFCKKELHSTRYLRNFLEF